MANDQPDPDVTLPRSAAPAGDPVSAPSTVRAADTESDPQTDGTLLPNSNAPSTDAGDATRVPSTDAARPFGAPGLLNVPGYVVAREVARGGMGTVYLAHDPTFDRDVAVKVMHPGQDADRFVIESKVTAQLPHPGVPPVYALGTLGDGRPFLAMKLIQGKTLADELRGAAPADLPRLLSAFEHICQTVGFAHARGIIHRDLKPANVMVGAFGEVLVMDWGLARAVGSGQKVVSSEENDPLAASRRRALETNDETQAGQVKGTPAYMAPEQARGEPVDARADVFALGGILAAVLTGKAPFGGTTIMETVQKAAQADLGARFARLDECTADPDLIAVAKTCMAPRADDRYANGEAVAAAVSAYRASVEDRLRTAERERAAAEAKAAEEVNTRREAEARAAEQRKRRKVQFALVASVALFALASGAVAWYSDRQESERKLRAERAAAEQLAKDEREAADRRATEARLAGERDAEARNKAQQARDGATAGLALATTLRQQYKFKEAKAALEQAAKLTAGAPELLPRVEQARRDLAFVEQLDDIRYRKWMWSTGAKGGGFDTKIAPPAYRKEFAARGLDLTTLEPAEAAERVAGSAVKSELVAALDDWALYEPDERLRDRLLEIARRAEPRTWTNRLRDPAVRNSLLGIASLAADAASAAASPAAISALAELMEQNGLDSSMLLAAARVQYPADFELSFYLGQVRHAKRRSADAIGPYEAARAVRPDNAAVWNNLGAALFDKGDTAGAFAAFKRTVELDPNYAPAHNNLGKLSADKGDRDAAIILYKKAIEADPKHVNAHLGLGNVLLDQKDFDGAVASFKAVIEIEPDNAGAHNNLGNSLVAKGDPDAALKSYKAATEHDSKYALPWHGTGSVLETKGDPDGAIAAYKRALEIDPKFASALINLGNILQTKGDIDGAIATHKKAVDADPKNSLAHYNLGRALWAKDDAKGAAAAFREAIKLNPDFFQAHTNLSGTLNDLGDADGSIAAAREAMRCDPKDSRPHNNMGIALVIKGDLDGAVASFREAVRLNPDNRNAKENLQQALKDKAARDEKIAPPPREVKRP